MLRDGEGRLTDCNRFYAEAVDSDMVGPRRMMEAFDGMPEEPADDDVPVQLSDGADPVGGARAARHALEQLRQLGAAPRRDLLPRQEFAQPELAHPARELDRARQHVGQGAGLVGDRVELPPRQPPDASRSARNVRSGASCAHRSRQSVMRVG